MTLDLFGLQLTPEFAAVICVACAAISAGSALCCVFALRAKRTRTPAPLPLAATPPASWSAAYFDGMLHWASGACRELSQAIHLAESPAGPERERRFGDIRASLSHLIDTGYWYFPNSGHGKQDEDHPPAYRGTRHAAVDLLVAARELVGQTDAIGLAALTRAKREFVSHIQILANPRRREEGIESVLRRFASVGEEPAQPV